MSQPIFTLRVRDESFSRLIRDYAAAAMMNVKTAIVDEAMFLADELCQRTPPFAGRKLKRMLEARDQQQQIANAGDAVGPFRPKSMFSDPDIEKMSALKIGKRRVERDIRRVIYGVRGATMPARKTAQVFKSQNTLAVLDWGILQKCENKDAVRIFATKKGEVYGVDYERFKADASMADMRKTHQEHRISRGHVTMAGQRDRVVGRWRWLNVLVTKEALVEKFIKFKQNYVGQGKGGWGVSFVKLGGKLSPNGWVGKHAYGNGVPIPGRCDMSMSGDNVHISMVNHSAWASGGDPDRIMHGSMEGRARVLTKKIRKTLEGVWGNRSRRARTK